MDIRKKRNMVRKSAKSCKHRACSVKGGGHTPDSEIAGFSG